jgi:thiol-disulfide isomerase/thioredoxin
LTAGCFIGLGAGARWLGRTRVKGVSTALSIFGRACVFFGFFVIGIFFEAHLSGRYGGANFLNNPSFYLTGTVVLASAVWWSIRQSRLECAGGGIGHYFYYPVALVLAIGSVNFGLGVLERRAGDRSNLKYASAIGDSVPDFQFIGADGAIFHVSDFKGKIVLLNFWATYCAPCVEEMPRLSEMYEEFRDRGFVLVYLSSEPADVREKFFAQRRLEGLHGEFDPRLIPNFYQAGKALPTSFIIDRSGALKSIIVGSGSDTPREMKEVISGLL